MSEERKVIFMDLYGPNHSRFERFCKARVYGEMDYKDLMHDTVVAFQKFDPSSERARFLSFLFGIAIRVMASTCPLIASRTSCSKAQSTGYHLFFWKRMNVGELSE